MRINITEENLKKDIFKEILEVCESLKKKGVNLSKIRIEHTIKRNNYGSY